ncbi:MAG: LytTR family DNA-binding domain-containing protein [Lewinella sp.]
MADSGGWAGARAGELPVGGLIAWAVVWLDGRFLRVHRKYPVNTDRIAGITPHLRGRYVLTFSDAKSSSIRSSAGYTDQVKALLQL